MTDRDSLYRGVLAAPDDDQPRLVLARGWAGLDARAGTVTA